MSEVKNETLEREETSSKVYELGYLLVPTIAVDDVPVHYGNLKELVSSLGGIILSDEMPKAISIAYAMSKVIANVRQKFNTAYFGWIKFTMDAQKVLELKKSLDLDHNLIRFLVLKTVKENTIASRRFMRSDAHKRPAGRRSPDGEAPLSINKEEIDKEIDALVAN